MSKIEDIVAAEQRLLPYGVIPRTEAQTGVRRAAFKAGRLPLGDSLEGLAELFGVTAEHAPVMRVVGNAPIPQRMREELGYPDAEQVPDELIRRVRAEISDLTPDHFDPTPLQRVGARTMSVVALRPSISPGSLREELATRWPNGLAALPNTHPATLALYGGAIVVAHGLTAAHLGPLTQVPAAAARAA